MSCRYAVDLVVCVALGCDMFDCVFPTRTAVSSLHHTHTLIITFKRSCSGYNSISRIDFNCHDVSFPSEVRLCLGALGISPGKT